MFGDVEVVLARHTVRRAVIIGPIIVSVFAAISGVDGAIASFIGVVIVVGYFLLNGLMLATAARISLGAYHAAALLGFFLRMGLIAVTMISIAAVVDIDRLALGITVVVAFLALLTWETVAVATGTEREFEWVS